MWSNTDSSGWEDSNTPETHIMYMKEGHYYHYMGLSTDSDVRCHPPEDAPELATKLQELDTVKYPELIGKVRGVVLYLTYERFEPEFQIGYWPMTTQKRWDIKHVGSIDISQDTAWSIASRVQASVLEKLEEAA